MKWTIKSHRLVHFNPRHKLMRIFLPREAQKTLVNNTESDFSRYRRAVSHVLDSLEISLTNINLGGLVTPFVGTKNLADDGKVEITKPMQSALWDKYIKYCVVLAKSEEVGDEVMDALRGITDGKNLTIPKKYSQDILSLMPILPHWDTMGIFSQKTNRGNSVLIDMLNYREPVYLVKNIYSFSKKNVGCSAKSKEILGYPVMTSVAYADLASTSPEFQYTQEEDYFSLFHCPTNDESTNNFELDQYRAYGWLYDSIENGNVREDVESYTLIYPIVTLLGRRSFWHIELQPDTSAGLAGLVEAWRFVHMKINWPLLSSIVSSELEQVDWAYAQSLMAREAGGDKSGQSPSDIVAEHAMMFFPMNSFLYDKKKWVYRKYHGGELDRNNEFKEDNDQKDPIKLDCGRKWEKSNEPGLRAADWDTITVRYNKSDITIVPDKSAWRGTVPLPIKIRCQHIIEQQLELTRQLALFKRGQYEQFREEWRNTRNAVLNWIDEQNNSHDLAAKVNEPLDALKNETLPNGAPINNLYELVQYICDKTSSLSQEDCNKARVHLEKGLVTVASSLLACFPVKAITHEGPQLDEAGRCELLRCINESLAIFKGRSISSQLDKWPHIKELVYEVQKIQEVTRFGSHGRLKEKVQAVRSTHSCIVEFFKKHHAGLTTSHNMDMYLPVSDVFDENKLSAVVTGIRARDTDGPIIKLHGVNSVCGDVWKPALHRYAITFEWNSDNPTELIPDDGGHGADAIAALAAHLESYGVRTYIAAKNDDAWSKKLYREGRLYNFIEPNTNISCSERNSLLEFEYFGWRVKD